MRAVLLVGLPGCGKSSLAAGGEAGVEINRDAIREELFGSRAHHGHEGLVSREHARRIRLHAARGEDLLLSDTHTQRRKRREIIRELKQLGYRVEVWVLDVATETCLARNQARPVQVPEEIIRRMSRRLLDAPPGPEEGMDALRVIRQVGVPTLFPAGSAPAEYESPPADPAGT